MILLFSSVGLWRQQLHPDARVHGIIQEGGSAANIIPERTRAWFMLRSPDQVEYERMKSRFRSMAEAAATATDTTAEITFSGGAKSMKQNVALEARWVANAAAYGIVDQGPDPNSGSTDMANVSWVCPTIHPELAIADEGTPGHSILFRDAAATQRADETTLLAATLVAQTAYELFADPTLVEATWQEFRGQAKPVV
jgi:metal-dependent amidase/aminoacylase/carboxypeptidase family protein